MREHRDRALRRSGANIAQKVFEHQLVAAVAAAVGSGDHDLPPGRENSAADFLFAQRHGGEGKLLCRPVAERCAELFAQRRIAREHQNIRCKRGGIAGGDEKAVNAVFHKLRHAADGGRNDRHAVFCRVGERIGKRLRKGREKADIQTRVESFRIIEPAGEMDAVGNAELFCQRAEHFLLRARSGENETELRLLLCSGGKAAQHRGKILHRVEPRRGPGKNIVRRGGDAVRGKKILPAHF